MSGAAARIFRPVVASWNWLRMAWATQPVLFVSGAMAIAGPLWVLVRPGTKVYLREIETWPSHYRGKKDKSKMDDY
ncbi:hypothetical protein GBAR_LOCUS11421 [Geodia barretti]|uniref:Uncharacterized protein n=1 Tax=Geodia barretti TaxID=519541 RepID=A0AA35RW94_GEOBA|nr:hypothetical protein GBAR_LOCUS11421 [Geodia barretti]